MRRAFLALRKPIKESISPRRKKQETRGETQDRLIAKFGRSRNPSQIDLDASEDYNKNPSRMSVKNSSRMKGTHRSSADREPSQHRRVPPSQSTVYVQPDSPPYRESYKPETVIGRH